MEDTLPKLMDIVENEIKQINPTYYESFKQLKVGSITKFKDFLKAFPKKGFELKFLDEHIRKC